MRRFAWFALLFALTVASAAVQAAAIETDSRDHIVGPLECSGPKQAIEDLPLLPWQRNFISWLARNPAMVALDSSTPPAARAETPDASREDGKWLAVPPPSRRYGHTAVFDPRRNRMLIFGGVIIGGAWLPRNEVWELSMAGKPRWRELFPSGVAPKGRFASTAVYDAKHDRMIVFGGVDASLAFTNDVWALSLSGTTEWAELQASGVAPDGRAGHSAIYDPLHRRMIVFGGADRTHWGNDAWALSLGHRPAWKLLNPAGMRPEARVDHRAIYDPIGVKMIVFGGYAGQGEDTEVWALALKGRESWTQLQPVGTPPAGRVGHSAVYDPTNRQMIVFGGQDSLGRQVNDLGLLSLSGPPAWTQPRPAGSLPPARGHHTAVYDPLRERMLVFGGTEPLNDVWALDVVGPLAWEDAVPTLPKPGNSYLHTAVYDPARRRMLVFGGLGSEVWQLSLGESPVWAEEFTSGPSPGARYQCSSIYDPLRDRVLVFGGRNETVSGYLNDVWALSLSGTPTWSQLSPAGPLPSPRAGHAAIYDPVRDRMLVFGGNGDFGCRFLRNDVWALSLSGAPTWSKLTPVGSPPPPTTNATLVYDPVRDRVVHLGGQCDPDPPSAWMLTLAHQPRWDRLSPAGTPPPELYWHTSIYDPLRDRMVVFGGFPQLSGTWSLSFSGSGAWSTLQPRGAPPVGRYGHVAIYDGGHDRMVIHGGALLSDVWLLAWGGVHGHDHFARGPDLDGLPSERPGVAIAPAAPNPMRESTVLRFRLPTDGPASLTIYDAAGRRVRSLVSGVIRAGNHSALWDGRDEGGRRVRFGVYFCRLQVGRQTLSGAIALIP